MTGCIFCGIIAGSIPASKVYEDEHFIAIMDIAPVHPGHTLVLPKNHHQTFLEMPAELAKDFSHVTKVLSEAIKTATNADGINISTNVGSAAGQSVDHAHFHIIPRYKGDGLNAWPQKSYAEGEIEKVAQLIRDAQ